MNTFPQVTSNYLTERDGVLKIARDLNNFGLIFRETPNADIGIDGQIEYVNKENLAIGKLVAAQIKSGDSYFNDKGDHWAFSPSGKHKSYWESYPIPVILFIYSPSTDKTYYIDVRYQLNNHERKEEYISIPKVNVFNEKTKEIIFESFGPLDEPFLNVENLLREMVIKKCANPQFPVSYFDLFVNGLTDLCRQIFISMSLAMDIADFNNKGSVSIGPNEHEFLHNYARFLLSQNIAKLDYGSYLTDWREREIQPIILSPLTNRGLELTNYISNIETTKTKTNLISERFLEIEIDPLKLTEAQEFLNQVNIK